MKSRRLRWFLPTNNLIFRWLFCVKFLYDLLRVIGLKLFSVGGPAKIRNLDGRTTFSVRLGVWLTRLTVRIEPLFFSDKVEFFPIHVFYHDGQIWRSEFCFSCLIITITTCILMLYNLFTKCYVNVPFQKQTIRKTFKR